MSLATQFPVTVGDIVYTSAPEDLIPDGHRTSAIVQARLTDELTTNPVAGPLTVQPAGLAFARPRARSAVNPRSTDGGVVGLVGIATQSLPALRTTAYEVGLTASAPGYIDITSTQMFGPNGTFPDGFVPANLGDLPMHRQPVSLYGRANVRTATTFNPLHNATVAITGIWRTAPTLTVSPPASPPNIAAVDPVLYAARPVGASVRIVTLTANMPKEKRLLRPAVTGARQVYLSDSDTLGPNNVLGIDESDPSRAEWVVVHSITGGAVSTDPAVATLEFPLLRSHASGALAHPTNVSAPTASQPLAIDAIAGDTTLLLTAMTNIVASAVEITGGNPIPEYHTLALYSASTDPDGQWRMRPLSRVSQIIVTATHATQTSPPPRTLTVEYPRFEQRLDLVFT